MQTGLRTLWGVSQSAVSQTLQQLTTAAAVEALPRKGRDPIQYMLTGTARLAQRREVIGMASPMWTCWPLRPRRPRPHRWPMPWR